MPVAQGSVQWRASGSGQCPVASGLHASGSGQCPVARSLTVILSIRTLLCIVKEVNVRGLELFSLSPLKRECCQ